MGFLGTASRAVHVLLLALWLGGCAAFAAIVAPSVFLVVPSRDVAGDLITLVLSRIDMVALMATPILFVTLLLGWLPLGSPLRVRILAIFAMAGAVALSSFWITPEMLRIRHSMIGPIETIALDDPGRLRFNELHGYSTALMAVHVGLAFVLLLYAIGGGAAPKRRGTIEL